MSERFIPVAVNHPERPMNRLQTALAARRNVLEIIPAVAYRQPIVSGVMLVRWHMLADPTGLRRVLLDNLKNFPKSEIMKRMVRPAIGGSLFNAEGAEWKWQRQAVAPVFTSRHVMALAPAMSATAERACARLAASGGSAELVSEMMQATFDVICDIALSGRDHFDGQRFRRAITQYFKSAGRPSVFDFLGAPAWWPRPELLAARHAVRTMHAMVGEVVRRRLCAVKPGADDLLDRMLSASDPESGRRMTPEDVVHNMQFFIVAGHETTALAIAWALYLLAHTPDHQERARQEAQVRLGGRAAGADDLAAMPFVGQVLDEAMRLYPPVGLLARHAVEQDELCGRAIRPDDTVFLPIWALHRHHLLWENPDAFDPERFSPVRSAKRDKFQFLPFGAGPRACVGANFATMQAQIILATLLQLFRFKPARPEPRPVMTMTVRPEPGIRLFVEAAE